AYRVCGALIDKTALKQYIFSKEIPFYELTMYVAVPPANHLYILNSVRQPSTHIMILPLLALIGLTNAAVIQRDSSLPNIVIGNDDGWATANIRSFYDELKAAGFKAIISAPADNKSGTSGLDLPPIPLITAGEFNTIPALSPATGSDSNDPNIHYVNSFPATAVRYGIDEFAPKVFGAKPQLVVTGVNVGGGLNSGAATLAVDRGIPAIAFSGKGGSQHIYSEPDSVADVYAKVATKVVQTVVAAGAPYLPAKVGLNVNIGMATESLCQNPSDFKFVLSRLNPDINPLTDDVDQCGTNHLPTESSVLGRGNCYVSISAFSSKTKLDVSKDVQKVVRDKLASILTCN
ncbi:13297_t:CDS:2, partial [Acaulospora colombiana]